MVCMNTEINLPATLSNNEILRALVKGAQLTQPVALTLFNRGLGVRAIKESTWKGYFCDPAKTRFRPFSDDLLGHAKKAFEPLQKT